MIPKLRVVVLLLSAVVGWVCGPSAAASADRPNIVLIVADDLSPEWVGFLDQSRGKFLTPTLDRLAAEGAVLANLHSTSPVCTPSRFTLLTGQYASRAQNRKFLADTRQNDGQTAVAFNTHIVEGQDNVARRLRDAGYATGAVGKNHVIEAPDFQRLPYNAPLGDPETTRRLASNAKAVEAAFRSAGFDYAASLYHGNPDADGIRALAAHNQDWITAGALEFLDAHHDEPFFLYVATTIPHGPHADERSWRADPTVTANGLLADRPEVQPSRDSIAQRLEAAGATGWNAANVLWLDDGIDAIMTRLEQLGVADNTIVIFVSDHGTRSKGSVYRGGTQTVGLIWRQGGFAASEVDAGLTLMDFAPSILSWCGVDYEPDAFDGVDITPVLAGSEQEVRDALFFEVGYTRGVQKEGWKLVEVRYPPRAEAMSRRDRSEVLTRQTKQLEARGRPIPTDDPMAPFSHLFLIPGGADAEQVSIRRQPHYFDRTQLYDLSADPDEQRNLADQPEHAAKLAELRALLANHLLEMPGTFGDGSLTPEDAR